MSHKILILFILLFSFSAIAYAQSDLGTVRGTVRDGSAPVPGASVILRESGSDRGRTVETDGKGVYVFTGVEPGIYNLTAQQPSRLKGTVSNVSVSFGETVTIDIAFASDKNFIQIDKIDANQIKEQFKLREAIVNRQASIPGRVGVNLAKNDVRAGNDDLARLPLGTTGATLTNVGNSTNPIGGFSFNGISSDQNSVIVDGADVTPVIVFSTESDQDPNSSFTNVTRRQSLSAFREFRLDESNNPAYFGLRTGGILIAATETGKEKLKGSISERFMDESFNARNYFDQAIPWRSYHQFGATLSGPLNGSTKKGKPTTLTFSLTYEGVQARSESSIFEAVPSASARARAAPAVLPIINAFYTGRAFRVPGASANPDLDVMKLETRNVGFKNSLTSKVSYKSVNKKTGFDVTYIRSGGQENAPESIGGRRQISEDREQTAIANYKRNGIDWLGGIGTAWDSETIFSLNITPSRLGARAPEGMPGVLSNLAIGVGGSVTPTGIPNQTSIAIANPGGLLRKNSSFLGRGLRATPAVFSATHNINWTLNDKHTITFGGEFYYRNTYLNTFNGITYRFSTLEDLLQNRPATVQLAGDLGNPSPLGVSSAEDHHTTQQIYAGYFMDKWAVTGKVTLTLGVRYDYFTVLKEGNDRAVVFDAVRGVPLSTGTPFYRPSKTNFQPRIAVSWDVNGKNAKNPIALSVSFGGYAGLTSYTNQTRPIESDRFDITQTGGVFPTAQSILEGLFFNNPTDRLYSPLSFDAGYTNTERAYKYDVTLKKQLYKNEKKKRELNLDLIYAGSTGKDLPLLTTANRITGVATATDPAQPAVVTREFDIPQGGGNVLRPYGPLEVRTSDGWTRYDSFQAKLNGLVTKSTPLKFEAIYTLGRLFTNQNGTSIAGDPLDLDFDRGLSFEDVRHKFGVTASYPLPFGKDQLFFKNADGVEELLLGNWELAGKFDWQGGRPIDVKLTRPSVVYVNAAGQVFSSPAAGRVARINVPGGTAGNQRPDLIPGVDPFLRSGDRTYLNPAAFAIPAPGTLGNLRRGALRGPDFRFLDLSIKKTVPKGANAKFLEFRCDITNLLNRPNFDRPAATLSDALGVGANLLQPGQPFNSTIAPAFGIMNRTLKRKPDMGASRQVLFGFTVNLQ